jgi:multiple sugar transport system ATP-binding protein
VENAARILHLDQRLEQKPGQLSGGQRQRVAIGRAIVREPKIFLFDEPLSNLDAALRADMRIELTRLHKALGATMIYVTHDQIEAMTMADRIVVLNAGIIAQVGTPMELYHEPQNLFVAQFIGNPRMNLVPVTCAGAGPEGVTVETGGQRALIPVEPSVVAPGQPLSLGIRPEHVRTGAGDLTLNITPTVIERLGQQTIGYAQLPGSAEGFCLVLSGETAVAADRPLPIGIRAADCHLFDAAGQAFRRRVDLSAFAA